MWRIFLLVHFFHVLAQIFDLILDSSQTQLALFKLLILCHQRLKSLLIGGHLCSQRVEFSHENCQLLLLIGQLLIETRHNVRELGPL